MNSLNVCNNIQCSGDVKIQFTYYYRIGREIHQLFGELIVLRIVDNFYCTHLKFLKIYAYLEN